MTFDKTRRVFDMRDTRQPPRQKLYKPKLPKRWQHQDELDAHVGKDIKIVFRDETTASGILLAADQFTIKIDCRSGPVTYFKHDMSSYAFFKDPA